MTTPSGSRFEHMRVLASRLDPQQLSHGWEAYAYGGLVA